ncbi:fasciclin domain-containing protein [Pontibacter sp. H259]|uniref:fasciclin domain-containing protein n=1 Tax=Pontibacter sp. H259 TaxID=3133421 RepID=UPI0030BC4E15
MKITHIWSYGLSLLFSITLLTGCGSDEDKHQKNDMQEQHTEPDPGSQQGANSTEPTTDGRQTGEDGAPVYSQIGGTESTPSQSIPENAESTTDLATFISAVKTAGLLTTLNGTGPYTVFAPTNEAFKALPSGSLEDLMKPENKKQLTELLNNHMVAGKLDAATLQGGSSIKTLNNSQLQITKQGDKVLLNGAEVNQQSIPSSNGIIYTIDKVLVQDAR